MRVFVGKSLTLPRSRSAMICTAVSLCSLVLIFSTFLSHQMVPSSSSSTTTVLPILDNEEPIKDPPRELLRDKLPLHGWSATQSSRSLPPGEHLLVIILFSQSHEQREGVRNSWKKDLLVSSGDTLVMFAVGIEGMDSVVLNKLKEEQDIFKDVLLLQDVGPESSRTVKLFHVLKWLDQSVRYTYTLIGNDHCYVRVDKLNEELRKRTSKTGLYWGYFVGNAVPQKSGPWAENRWFLCDRYLPYALAGAYVLSSDIIHNVMINSDLIQLYNNDDVSVGVWTSAFDMERRHDLRFDVEAMSRGCRNDFLVTCSHSVDNLMTKYTRLKETRVFCVEERVEREYVYNWTAKPSKCCQLQ